STLTRGGERRVAGSGVHALGHRPKYATDNEQAAKRRGNDGSGCHALVAVAIDGVFFAVQGVSAVHSCILSGSGEATRSAGASFRGALQKRVPEQAISSSWWRNRDVSKAPASACVGATRAIIVKMIDASVGRNSS